MTRTILCHVLTGVAVAHVVSAMALLIAVLGGVELRTIVGLLGALVLTGAWLLWLRERVEEARTVEEVGQRHLASVPAARDAA